jgi:hypothetical protein
MLCIYIYLLIIKQYNSKTFSLFSSLEQSKIKKDIGKDIRKNNNRIKTFVFTKSKAIYLSLNNFFLHLLFHNLKIMKPKNKNGNLSQT